MRRTMSLDSRPRGAWTGAVLSAAIGIGCLALTAGAQDIDLSLPQDHPGYTDVAPVPFFEPAIDAMAPELQQWGGGPDNSPQQVSANVTTGGSTASDFVGLILDRDPDDNLFIKVQQQFPNPGKFTHIGFYHDSGVGGGWTGMTGGIAFFTLAAADQFTSARMTVTHDGAGTVTLRLTNVVGGTNNQVYVRGGWTPRSASSSGFGGWNGIYPIDNWGVAFTGDTVCDNFNRSNGGLGPDWVTTDGTTSIAGNAARGNGLSQSLFVGSCGVVVEVEADIEVFGSGNSNSGLVANFDGSDNIYIKVQQQQGGGEYDSIGFYHLSGPSGGWPGLTGGASFFFIPVADRFVSAHMKVTLDGSGTVRLILTNIDGNAAGVQEYQRGGWTILAGTGIGFGGWNGDSSVDDIEINGIAICDAFNRPNGPLGPNWNTTLGNAAIVSNAARGGGPGVGTGSVSIFTGICGACNDTTPPNVDIDAPASFSCVCQVVNIMGTVEDLDGTYVGDQLEYRRSDVAAWTLAATANGPRTGVLYSWAIPAPLVEGWYFLRVTGQNDCGLSSSDMTVVRISRNFDAAVLRTPLSGDIRGGRVCFDGTATDNACFRLYTVTYRPAGVGAYAPVDPANPFYAAAVNTDPLATWLTSSGPTAVPDGDYDVRLEGVDQCGNTNAQIETITVDNTAPVSIIASPLDCDYVNGIVQVIGTASDANLRSWTLQYTGGGSGGWVTISSGNAPVINGVLGNWNTNNLPICAYTLRLVVTDDSIISCSSRRQTITHVSVNVGELCDINGDGVVNAFDIEPFLNCLFP